MWVFSLYVCLNCIHVSGAHWGLKRVAGHLEVELEMVVSLHTVLGIEPQPSGRAAGAVKHRAISPALIHDYSYQSQNKHKPFLNKSTLEVSKFH